MAFLLRPTAAAAVARLYMASRLPVPNAHRVSPGPLTKGDRALIAGPESSAANPKTLARNNNRVRLFQTGAQCVQNPSVDVQPNSPIIGPAFCCACAANGHAAAPPNRPINARRLIDCPAAQDATVKSYQMSNGRKGAVRRL